ncbi:MAG: penicillin-binding protein activator [Methylococcales bacterium]|nr:penicillin-binding protein activator [Methylococcales bacterium]
MYNPEINQAEAFLKQGKNKEAATIYKKLATLNTNQRNQFNLLAADALIGSGDAEQGKKYITVIDSSKLTPAQYNHLKLLQAQIALSVGEAKKSLNLFETMEVKSLDTRSKFAYYDSLALSHSLLGSPLKSVQALVALTPFIVSSEKRLHHYDRILDILMKTSVTALNKRPVAATKNFNGWVALVKLLRSNNVNLSTSLAKWRQTHPNHPVTSDLLLSYEKKYQNQFSPPASIALFLPKSGRYAEAARVIKQGFMAAYNLAVRSNPNQPKVVSYDTESASITDLYSKAINNGAQLIVGPLNKKYLRRLATHPALNIPVLALNHDEGLSHPRLYQFGLSPIDDAEQVAYKAYQDGHNNALLLIPNSKRGQRIQHYFTSHWQHLGASIASVHNYDPAADDLRPVIKQVAHKLLENKTTNVIFMNAYSKQAGVLNPLLRYKKTTSNIPIYATSNIYLGSPNKFRDETLNGIIFCDIPWVFEKVYTGALSKTALYTRWSELNPLYLRLLPLGIDAYNLTSYLDQLKTEAYPGATGQLTLGADNRINRELFCAKFVNGEPHLLNFSSKKTPFVP